MVFLEVAEFLTVLLIMGVLLTQVIIPILMGRPVFPILKRKNKTMDQALAEAKEEVDLVKKKKQLDVLRAELEEAEENLYEENTKKR